MGASGGFMLLWGAIPIWASGCCMGGSGGFMGQLYAVSYSVLVHIAWGAVGGFMEALRELWRM